ncbi:hypothetical protein HGRIS_007452 [Hohenbuehelia grisea]|uniref:Peptidase A1 domain-containing protein n=1 Tax=Hohenbuehelia grisea TaxID=104357 RepID=A0ABR3J595_9AGAR
MPAKSITIPLDPTSDLETRRGLRIQASIGSSPSRPPFMIDTGSTGILVSKEYVGPDAERQDNMPFELLYTTSLNSYTGYWYKTSVSFYHNDKPLSVSTTPMMVRVPDVYTPNPATGKPPVNDPKGVCMMGVGFDRPSDVAGKDAQGHTIPIDINPFLLIAGVSPSTGLNPGFILTSTSITLGLTPSEPYYPDFTIIQLTRPPPPPPGHGKREWIAPLVQISVPTRPEMAPFKASLLLDTGYNKALVYAPGDAIIPTEKGVVDNQENLVVSILAASGAHVPIYNFVTGKTPPAGNAPDEVDWFPSTKLAPFINTGMRPIMHLDYLYDDVNGRLGFRLK